MNARSISSAALLLTSMLVAACAAPPLTPGKVFGDIVFNNTSPDVAASLAGNPSVASSPSLPDLQPVRLYEPGLLFASVTAQYTPSSVPVDVSTYRVGQFELYPNITSGTANFLLGIDELALADGSRYRFGSTNPAASAAIACNGVASMTDNPGGTQCSASECAAVVNPNVRLSGAQADLDAVEDSLLPTIGCTATAEMEELAGSGIFTRQANSGVRLFRLSELKPGSASPARIPLLVRSSSSPVRVTVGCAVKIKSGYSGFEVNPSTGLTPVGAASTMPSLACGQTIEPSIEPVVERRAGALEGYFDISGHTEDLARVCVDRIDSGSCVPAPLAAAGAVPVTKWRFDGILAGSHAVMAYAVFDNGERVLKFPYRDGANGSVNVLLNATTDLGATFVARNIAAQGTVRLYQPNPPTLLQDMASAPFANWYTSTSYMGAHGDSGLATAPDGASGFNGESRARLGGSYDLATKQASLAYELGLNGLSPVGGNLDGNQFRPTPWDVDLVHLFMQSQSGTTESLNITPAYDIHYTVSPSQLANPPLQVAEQRLCFGDLTIDLNVDAAAGSIYEPYLSFNSEGVSSPHWPLGTPFVSANGSASGLPRLQANAGPSASVKMTLPEGYRYHIWPWLRFAAAGSSAPASYVNLPAITVPNDGVVKCGAVENVCLEVVDGSGTSRELAVSVVDPLGVPAQYCMAQGPVSLNMVVASSVNVVRTAWVLDPAGDPSTACRAASANVLCSGSCGTSPTYPITLPALAAGPHLVYACAQSESQCVAGGSYPFVIDPDAPALQCAPDFTVVLDNATSILASDSRIAGLLNARVTGNCGPVGAPTSDAPATFTTGTTTVTFNVAGLPSCTTRVTVKSIERVVAYVTDDPNLAEPAIRARNFPNHAEAVGYSAASPYHFEYSDDGARIAVVPNATGAVRILDSASFATLATFGVPSGRVFSDVAFDPTDTSRYAFVATAASNNEQHAIYLFKGTALLSSTDLSTLSGIAHMGRPVIAWSPDGTHVSAAFSDLSGGADEYVIWFVEWVVDSSGQLQQPPQVARQAIADRSARETMRELVYQGDASRLLATSVAMWRATTASGTTQLAAVAFTPNVDLDLSADGKTGAGIMEFPMAPLNLGMLFTIEGLDDSQHAPRVRFRQSFFMPGTTAISSDGQYVALAVPAGLAVFGLPAYTPVDIAWVAKPRNVEFKPYVP